MLRIDPAAFDPASVDPRTHEVNAEVQRRLEAAPATETMPPTVLRCLREEGKGFRGEVWVNPAAETVTIPGPNGALAIRVIRPSSAPRGVYLHIHGGGRVLGAPHHHDAVLTRLVEALGVATVSVEYRLAPEHRHPATNDDCEAAARWLRNHAVEAFGTDTLLMGGESAGANLTLGTLLRLRDDDDPAGTGFCGANLVYGSYDARLLGRARRWGDRRLVLTTPMMYWFLEQTADPSDQESPDLSPMLADLSRLPPALLTVGTLDPLLDDTLCLAPLYMAAGNGAELELFPGGIHGFDALPQDYPLKHAHHATVVDWMERQLRGSVQSPAALS